MYSCAYYQVYSVMLFVESGMIEVGHQETSVYMRMCVDLSVLIVSI